MALNAIPIIVLVPVFNNMFSSTTEVPRRLMVTLVVSFIVLVNVAKGLRQVERHPHGADALLRGVDRRTILRKARIPNAVSYLFTALKIAAPVAVITAFVAEYFGGSQNGLGYGITSQRGDLQDGGVVGVRASGACLLGLAFYLRRGAARARWSSPSCQASNNQHKHGVRSPGGATA